MKTTQLVESLRMTPDVFGSILRLRGTSTALIATPNGIAELKPVELNGYPQWVLIRSRDLSRPLFLFLLGVPANRTYEARPPHDERARTTLRCINWDQRGAM